MAILCDRWLLSCTQTQVCTRVLTHVNFHMCHYNQNHVSSLKNASHASVSTTWVSCVLSHGYMRVVRESRASVCDIACDLYHRYVGLSARYIFFQFCCSPLKQEKIWIIIIIIWINVSQRLFVNPCILGWFLVCVIRIWVFYKFPIIFHYYGSWLKIYVKICYTYVLYVTQH